MIRLFAPPIPEMTRTMVGGRSVEVRVRVNPRAKSYRLTLPHGREPVLTLPRHGRWRDAEAFLARQSDWLAARLADAPVALPFAAGLIVPLRGLPHTITPTGTLRGTVRTEPGNDVPRICVPGAPEHLNRRLTDWLKAEAHADLAARVPVHARRLGVTVGPITIRGQSSRWGSCSSRGALSFNWRLVLAPPFVLDYVAAHEVAHLLEMNHSPAFWRTVAKTLPEMADGRDWLKANGGGLMRLGRPTPF